jgi:folate-binding protein YgfZ
MVARGMEGNQFAAELHRARTEGGCFLLPSRIILRLSGSDAFRYLNGQITRDLNQLQEGETLPACILTPKGKLCAPLLIWREGADLLVEADPSLQESLLARLERYIVADDVTIFVEHSPQTIHCFGPLAAASPWKELPGLRVSRLGEPGRDFARSKDPHPPMLDPAIIGRLRIERCIPSWGSELGEETLPPEAGLDRTHIDYDRGCYPGQEVISRLKSVGRVTRLLQVLQAAGNASLGVGMPVVTEEGIKVGSITSVAPEFPGESSTALAYLQRGAVEGLTPIFALDPLTGSRTPLSITQVTGS